MDLALDRFDAPHVFATTVPANADSQGMMKRLGMKRREDLDFEDSRYGPELNPNMVYRVDADEWPAARAAALS